MGREMCYSIFFGCLLLFIVPLVVLAQPTSFFCKIRNGLIAIFMFFFYDTQHISYLADICIVRKESIVEVYQSRFTIKSSPALNCGLQILLSIVGEVTMISEWTHGISRDWQENSLCSLH